MNSSKNVQYYIFGQGSLSQLGEVLQERRDKDKKEGRVVFLVDDFFTDKGIENQLPIKKQDDLLIFVSTKEEPHADYINQLTDEVKARCAGELPLALVGMGGGTVMDIAKCVSILLTNPGKAEDYQGWDLVKNPAVYKIGIPTISGTGAEATRTAVLTSRKIKLGMNSNYAIFDQIILDPTLLKTVPKEQFVYTAMDCYLHDIELLKGARPIHLMSKAFAEKSLQLMREVFLEEMDQGKLMVASYLGGCAVANEFLHICHPLSYGLSLVLNLRHGLANCIVFNQLDDYFSEEIGEFREILKKFEVELPQGVTKGASEEEFDRMAEAALKNDKPLSKAFGENWQKIFTPEKAKEILRRI